MNETGINYYRKLQFAAKIVCVTVLLCAFLPKTGKGQQDPVYTQYLNNLLSVQPAYAGSTGSLNVTGISRAQWIGFAGAPNTNTLTIQGPLRRFNVGLGLSIVNDKWGPIRQNSVYLDYAYRIQLTEEQYLSFGMKVGANLYQAWLSDLVINDPNDLIFAYDVNLKFLPNVGAGILWHSNRFFLGASMPKFLKNRLQSQSTETVYREVLHFYGMGGYVFSLNDAFKFKPTVLYRWAERTPSYVDFSGTLIMYDRFWFGATYRMQNSYALIFQFNVNSQLKFGYSYDLTTFHPTQVNSGTHEFMISYDFNYGRRGRQITPRYF
jgi:type IX secretion system PorP/SprF family membrane protein